jgi:hypothetical protein
VTPEKVAVAPDRQLRPCGARDLRREGASVASG